MPTSTTTRHPESLLDKPHGEQPSVVLSCPAFRDALSDPLVSRILLFFALCGIVVIAAFLTPTP